MFRRLLLVFTDAELRIKIIKIILLLIGARLLAHIPIPILGIQEIANIIDSDAVFGLLNTISGGSYGRLSFVMLGVGPYITASIVMQLLGVIVPKISEIQKEEGELGKQKINRSTRWLTIPLAAFQSWAILQFLASGNSSKSKFGGIYNFNQICLFPNWETIGFCNFLFFKFDKLSFKSSK